MNSRTTDEAGGVAAEVSQQSLHLIAETGQWIGGHAVNILIATAIGTGIALVLLGVRHLGCRIMAKGKSANHWRTIFARALSKTSIFFIVLVSAELVAEHAHTPVPLMRAIHFLFVVAAAFQAAIWARELILGFVEHRAGPQAEHGNLGSAIGIIRLLVSVALFAIAIILILDNLGVNVTGLVAGLGIGGIAIGLAAQGIFSDLFAALSIIFDKPFRKGDVIRFDQISGTVEQIGLKTTRIRAIDGEQIVVSNAKLLEQRVHNFANLHYRRLAIRLGLAYQTPPELCANLGDTLRPIVEAHAHSKMVRCGMVGFGASTLDFDLVFDVHSLDYEYVFATRSAICVAILEAFNKAGITLAYPSQTSFTAAPDGTLVMPYPDVTMVATDDLDDGDKEIVKKR